MSDIERTQQALKFIAANQTARYPQGWIEEVNTEAHKLGLLKPQASAIGCNCRPDIDARIVYGGDMVDAS